LAGRNGEWLAKKPKKPYYGLSADEQEEGRSPAFVTAEAASGGVRVS
jgi:hypothetical protein